MGKDNIITLIMRYHDVQGVCSLTFHALMFSLLFRVFVLEHCRVQIEIKYLLIIFAMAGIACSTNYIKKNKEVVYSDNI